jgi:hypothetical protein
MAKNGRQLPFRGILVRRAVLQGMRFRLNGKRLGERERERPSFRKDGLYVGSNNEEKTNTSSGKVEKKSFLSWRACDVPMTIVSCHQSTICDRMERKYSGRIRHTVTSRNSKQMKYHQHSIFLSMTRMY